MKGERIMKKTFGIIALAALVMLASCKKNEQTTGTKLTAGIEQNKSNSKTSLNDLTITWSAGDQLYVNNGTAAACFTLTSNPGATSGEFATTGEYTFTDENVAVYPYNENITVGNNKVTMTLPAVQTASTSGTFGNGANPMLGVFANPSSIQLTSLCGVLCLQLTGDNVEITDIKIEGGADDKLNGTFEADYTVTSPVLTKTGDDGTNAVTLHLQETTTLTTTVQKFYVVLPAVTLTNGFTMKVYNGTNEIFSQSTTASLNIPVNTVESMNALEVTPTAATWDGNLSTLTGSEPAGYATATDGMTITGTLTVNSVKVSIADGANVTLQDATINGQSFSSYNYAGLNLLGSANITLVGTSTMSGGNEKAGIYAPEGGTLTISGDGTINATGGQFAAGIGSNYLGSSGDIVITNGSATINATGGYEGAGIGSGYKAASGCGNIEITDSFTGTVNATGHYGSPGIGSGHKSDCVNITISGGTINATGEDGGAFGEGAPGIGSGVAGSCGIININDGVTLVTAVKGNSAPCCIGKGSSATCGTINIGGTVYSDGVDANQGDGVTYIYPYAAPTVLVENITLNKTETTLTVGETETLSVASVQPSNATDPTVTWSSDNLSVATVDATTGEVTAVAAGTATITATANDGSNVTATCAVTVNAPAPTGPTGAINGLFKVSATQQVYFSKGNLQYIGSAGTPYWKFADNQWDYLGTTTGQNSTNQNVDRDLFGWGTWTGSNPNPANTSINDSDYSWDNSDFIQTLSNGSGTWRTLTKAEWVYLFNTRESGATVTTTSGTTNDARYTQATINTDGTSVNGIILFPDGVTIASGEATSWGNINSASQWTEATKCTAAQWTDLANKGCVFLPAAGYRTNAAVFNLDTHGYYWSSTYHTPSSNEQQAWQLVFYKNYVQPEYGVGRHYGRSVRLVQDN